MTSNKQFQPTNTAERHLLIPFEMCYREWQESLTQMATLVEPETQG